ncbi:hypothetical protein MBLNU230_g7395t1 [Neophaeotheca triangularis]
MKSAAFTLAAAAGTASAQQSMYGQCGGGDYPTDCVSGAYCHSYNDFYSQCIAGSPTSAGVAAPSGTAPASCAVVTVTVDAPSSEAAAPTTAAASSVPAPSSSETAADSSAQVQPVSSAAASADIEEAAASIPEPTSEPTFFATPDEAETTAAASSTSVSSQRVSTSTSAASSPAATTEPVSTSNAAATNTGSSGGVPYGGVNIAGFDFGCGTDGSCSVSGIVDPGQEGIDQMNHFVNDLGLNTFRLPVSWQYLVNDNLGGDIDSTNFDNYDTLMQGCLDVAELCIIDIHNYARWNGEIIGQGGPSNEQFASFWSQLAENYADNDKVAFGVMNEPHDVDLADWADTVQAAVTAIREAGASTNKILLPGNNWSHASTALSDGSAEALNSITNVDGSKDNLIFDVHQYLDSDGSGTSTECSTDHADDFAELGDWLRDNNRQAILTETGGGNTDSCERDVCSMLDQLNSYSDVYLGWTGWAAGQFDSSYELSETPTKNGDSWTDQPIVEQCIAGKFN